MIINFRVRLPQELRPEESLPPEFHEQYDAVLNLSANRNRTLAQLRLDMETASVDHAVVHAEYEDGDPADALNEAVAQVVADDTQHFSGFGTISMTPFRIRRAVQQVEKVAALGLVGVAFQPSFAGMPIDDRLLYPVYAKAAELNLPVAVHTGVNYTTHRPLKNEHPLQVDQVACDFPELTLVACHAGWPWVADLVAVMRRHPLVFAEFGGLSPQYVLAQGTGWETMHRFMNSLLAGQILFGTDWPVFPMDRALAEWSSGDLKPAVLAALTGGNAQRMLGIAPN